RFLLQRGILWLWNPGFVGGPLFQARSLRHRETENIGEDDGALDASSQGAREDRGRPVGGPRAGQDSDLFFAAPRQRRAVEIGCVRRADNLAMSHEDERRGHATAPPDTTPITRILS